MGTPLARHLIRAGYDVSVWNRTRAKAEELRSDKARPAATIAEAVSDAEIVVTMLADDNAVESTVLREGGVLEKLPAGAAHISMSTISVALSRRMEAEHKKRGHQYVAAPVFGRPDAAEAGKLFIAVAGDATAVERCRPVLEKLGQRIFVMGDQPEMANVVKLSGNFLIASVIESLGEAVAIVRKYGVDAGSYIEFLTNSLFAAPVYKTYGNIIAQEKYSPAGFKLRLGLKDIKLALAAAESEDAPMPFASAIRDHMLTAIARGMEDQDWSVTAKLAAENAGLK